MGAITYIFITLALISVLSCAPVDDSTAKPPATALSTSTANPTSEHHSQETKRQAHVSKEDSSSDSDESKESAESSEEKKKRPARDTENSAAVTHEVKDLPQGVIQTPPPVTKEAPKPQLPARETRETNEQAASAPGLLSAQHGSISTSSTPASTTAARS